MNIRKIFIVGFISVSLFGNAQALTKESKVKLAGVGICALSCLSQAFACRYLPPTLNYNSQYEFPWSYPTKKKHGTLRTFFC